MRLTTLWPDRTLLWKEWRGVAMLCALFAGYFTFASSYVFLRDILIYKQYLEHGVRYGMHNAVDLLQFGSGPGMLTVLFILVLGAVLVGVERDQRTYDLLLAMPYGRRQVFAHKFILGLGFVTAVLVVNALVMALLMAAHPAVPFPFTMATIGAWLLRFLVVAAFTLSFTLLIATLSGTTWGGGILGLIFLFFPLGFSGLIALNLDCWLVEGWRLYDTLLNVGVLLTVPTYVLDGHPIDRWDFGGLRYHLALVYTLILAATTGIYLLARHLFIRNQMEHNGEVLMFSKLEGFFKLGVGVCFALLGGPLIEDTLDPGPVGLVLGYLAVGAGFWLAANGLIHWRKRDAGEMTLPWERLGGGKVWLVLGLILLAAFVIFGYRVS